MTDRNAPPTVRSAPPRPPAEGLIPIIPDGKPGTPRTKAVSEDQYWRSYYSTHDETPDQLRETVGLLNASKKFSNVQAAIRAYLTYHSKNAEPWMYEGLALAIRMNAGPEEDVKTAFGYAADLAQRSHNPNYLVSVADQMLLLGFTDRVGPLLDEAADLVPHRGEPLVMSVNLAAKTHDPKRMGDSIDRLLSLGWAGRDDAVRRDARACVETLAKYLREEGRAGDADDLLNRLTASEARDVFVRLTWVGDADLDLVVDEPLGATARYSTPRTVFGGSIVKNGYGNHPEEVYVCPRGFDGEYVVKIETIYNNEKKPALTATLEMITHEGTAEEHKETKTIPLGKTPAPVKLTLKGGRRKTAMPFLSTQALAQGQIAGAARKALNKAAEKAPATKPAPKGAAPRPR